MGSLKCSRHKFNVTCTFPLISLAMIVIFQLSSMVFMLDVTDSEESGGILTYWGALPKTLYYNLLPLLQIRGE